MGLGLSLTRTRTRARTLALALALALPLPQLDRDSGAVKRLGTRASAAACQAAAAAAGLAGFAYYERGYVGDGYAAAAFASRCFGVVPVLGVGFGLVFG